MSFESIDLSFVDVSRNETVATSHIFAERSGVTETNVSYYDSVADMSDPSKPPEVYLRIKQERPKVSAQSFGTRRTTASLVHGYTVPTPKSTDLGGITFKNHVSVSVGVSAVQLEAAIARYRTWVNSPEFNEMIVQMQL